MKFVHETSPQRIRFATGDAAGGVAAEIGLLGAQKVMVIAAAAERDIAESVTAGIAVVLRHDEVVMHVPVDVAVRARAAASRADADAIVCVGGGSTTGLAKAVALTTGLPIVAVPTTYAGSEATNVWGMTEGAKKTTGTDPKVLPAAVVYDASLMFSLPVDLSVASGLNALAHCVDSLWAPRANPINAALAAEGARALAAGLPQIVQDPRDVEGREQALYGAYLAAVAFASAGSGLHHKICHVLGGKYDLPHAQTHATVLPYVLAFNAPNAHGAEERLRTAFGSSTGQAGLQALRQALDAPRALRDYGFKEGDIPAAVDDILHVAPATNPTPVNADNLARLLKSACEGSEIE
ncbi:maleylacetate reductase [Streptomyces sp. NPDC029554]|uniref:maleylacetate reductase n=1 Tax=Streptomyces sp. NPDC029554 TaxID=3155126 RepID=UPI0033F80761